MNGTIKWYSQGKGYGFILPSDSSSDLFFHVSDYKSQEVIEVGTEVTFEIGCGKGDRRAAKNVQFLSRPAKNQGQKRYFGKPTKEKGDFTPKNHAGTVAGIGIGMLFGPLGGLIGGVLGSGGFERGPGKLLTSECLRCGGTGHVTNVGDRFIGFQCEACQRFWKQKNNRGLKKSDFEEST